MPSPDSTSLLLNIERRRGDTTPSSAGSGRLLGPGMAGHEGVLRSFSDSPGGVLHAKAVVADEESVFITLIEKDLLRRLPDA